MICTRKGRGLVLAKKGVRGKKDKSKDSEHLEDFRELEVGRYSRQEASWQV